MKLTARGLRRPLLILVALAAVAVPGACSPSSLGAGTAVGPVPGADLQKFYAQKLAWGPCESYATALEDKEAYKDPAFDCSYLQVPIDYAQPNGKTAQIAVLRQKAGKQDQRIGSLVVNPGGPGSSGTSMVTLIGKDVGRSQLGARFDLIGFDPRGVGSSKPAIQCFTPRERDADRLDTDYDSTPAGVAKLESKAKDYDAKCEQKSGRDLLANAGTRDVVKDMDILRSALGDQKLTYLGYSYGTRIGSAYAEAFPNNVRALVLDGALDPDQGLIDRVVAQSQGFQKAFEVFAADCAKQPGCPLGPDPKAATDRFRKIVLPLLDKPVPLEDGRKLSYSDAITGTIQSLYAKGYWPYLRRGLQDLASGQSGRLMMGLADAYQGRQQDGTYAFTLDAFTSIGCVDDKPVTDPAEILEADKRARAVAPFRDDGRGANPAKDPCAFWPVPNTSEPHQPKVAGLPPVVVISTTGDPATPYQAGVNLAKSLNGRLISVQGTDHTIALRGTKCVDDAVTGYFIDLTLPPDNLRCTANPG